MSGAVERRPFTLDPANGVVFGELDVARCYAYRVPYAAQLYQRLLELVPGRERLLDLGCGPGKLARELAPHFREVVAVDPSAAMSRGREGVESVQQHSLALRSCGGRCA